MICAIYARVSTEDQHCELQLTDLNGIADRNGWDKLEYVDMESTRKRRPELERLLRDAKLRKFDVVICWKLDRFGRSVKELLTNVEALDLAGVRFIAGVIDTDKRNPVSRLTLHILAAVAEFERDLIRERVTAGSVEYRRAFAAGQVGQGKSRESRSRKNLAPGRPKRIFARDEAAKLRELGHSWRAISKHLGVSPSTIRDSLSC